MQEPFDQASLVRPYVKWEWTLPSGVVVKEALRRASLHHAERAARAGLSDDAARDADPALDGRRDPPLPRANNSPQPRAAAPIRSWSPRSPTGCSRPKIRS